MCGCGGRNQYSNVGWGKHYSEWLSKARGYVASILFIAKLEMQGGEVKKTTGNKESAKYRNIG